MDLYTKHYIAFEKIYNSDSHKMFLELRKHRRMLYVLKWNYRNLIKLTEDFHAESAKNTHWFRVSVSRRKRIQLGLATYLFNYLSSAAAIIDVSREVSKKHLNESCLELLKRTSSVFSSNIEYEVFRKLRNYIVHFNHLDVGLSTEFSIESGVRNFMYLDTNELLKWKKWNLKHKAFLQNLVHNFEIERIIKEYHRTFIDFQDQLYLCIVKSHLSEFQELQKVISEFDTLAKEHDLIAYFPLYLSRYLSFLIKNADRIDVP